MPDTPQHVHSQAITWKWWVFIFCLWRNFFYALYSFKCGFRTILAKDRSKIDDIRSCSFTDTLFNHAMPHASRVTWLLMKLSMIVSEEINAIYRFDTPIQYLLLLQLYFTVSIELTIKFILLLIKMAHAALANHYDCFSLTLRSTLLLRILWMACYQEVSKRCSLNSEHGTHSNGIIQRYCWIDSWLHFTAVILFSMLPTFEFISLVISRNIHIDRSVFAYQHWRTFVLWSCKPSRRHSLVLFFMFGWSSCIAHQSFAFSLSSRELSFIH